MRKANRTTKSKTKVIYKPLINKTPSDPSTILTAICNIEAISHRAAQQLALHIYDKQLFRDTSIAMWDDLARWKYFCPRIDGMYWLMNFVGSVGKQMKNSELDRLIKTTFSCVDKLLIGKKFPINIRALRLVAIELLRTLTDEDTTQNDITTILQDLSNKSWLAKHWIGMMMYAVQSVKVNLISICMFVKKLLA